MRSFPWSRFRQAMALALVATGVAATPAAAQVVAGIVVDEATGQPIPSAAVSLEGGPERRVVATDAQGRFQLRYSQAPPLTLHVSALGFLDALEEVTESALGQPIRITLRQAPLTLPGLDAAVEREGPDWKFMNLFVTDSGLVNEFGCYFMMSDSVVIKNYEWLKPEVYLNYERARMRMGAHNAYSVVVSLMRKYIFDDRLLEDAWPCGVHALLRQASLLYFQELPAPPTPEGAPVTLAGEAALRLPAVAPCPGSVAVSRTGAAAFVTAGSAGVHVVEPDGTLRWSLDPELPPEAPHCPLRIGWQGDTLWMADAARLTMTRILPDGSAEQRGTNRGLPAQRSWRTSERTMPDSPTATDLAVPVPAADGKWLWTIPAPDPPTPPIHPDDPPGRLLLSLTDEWNLRRVVTPLRPGVKEVDLALGPAPVLGPQPFRDHPLWAMDPGGRHVTLVEREHQMTAWLTAYRVTRFDLDADTVFHTERRALMSRVTDRVFDAQVAELASLPGARAAFPDDPEADDPSEGRRTLLGQMLYRPPFLPSISDVVVGYDGTTWLRWPDTMADQVRWEVLDDGGEAVRTFELDRRLRIVAADGDRVWATRLDPVSGTTDLVTLRVEGAEVTDPP